jgi:hypothetical protein
LATYTVSCQPLLLSQSLIQFLDTFTSSGKGRVPCAELQRAHGGYIEAMYLPEGVALKQYHHLRQEDINNLLKHWTHRQAASEVPFRFKKMIKAIQKNMCTFEENDADTGMRSGKEAEEDLQSDDESQAWEDGALQGDSGSNGSAEWAHPSQSLGSAARNPGRVG